MAEVLVFHHALGLTAGCREFADTLRGAGHIVHLPDLYDGQVFDDLSDGVAYAQKIGFETVIARGRQAVEGLAPTLVYVGFSLGVMPAESLAMTRPGARGAIFLHSAVPLNYFGGTWPQGVPLQIHTAADDPEGDVDAAREIAAAVPEAELFLYPGDAHLFTDSSLRIYDESAARLVDERVLAFLERLDA